jgi:Tfp pilus assembly protein PilF
MPAGLATALISLVTLAVGGLAWGLADSRTPSDVRSEVATPDVWKNHDLARVTLEHDPSDLAQAEAYLLTALAADSSFAPSYVALARIRQEEGNWPAARRHLEQALHFDPGNAEANLILGARALFTDLDPPVADAYLRRSLDRDPQQPTAHRLLAHVSIARGDLASAVKHADQARTLSPGDAATQGDAGWLYYWTGLYREAAGGCTVSAQLLGPTPLNQACLLSVAAARGDRVEAARIAARQLEEAGSPPLQTSSADRVLEDYYRWRLHILESEDGSYYARARLAALAERPAEALQHLRVAAERREVGILYAGAEPLFRSLRTERGFKDLVLQVQSD